MNCAGPVAYERTRTTKPLWFSISPTGSPVVYLEVKDLSLAFHLYTKVSPIPSCNCPVS